MDDAPAPSPREASVGSTRGGSASRGGFTPATRDTGSAASFAPAARPANSSDDSCADLDASLVEEATRSGSEYSVRVAVRVRPLLPKELQQSRGECLSTQPDRGLVVVGRQSFVFDMVFCAEASQVIVHDDAALPLVEGLGQGLNATLLAYGQTSAGKTYTLGSFRSAVASEEQCGIIPRFVRAMFRDIVDPKQEVADTSIRVSFLELHNEDINDLLDFGLVDKSKAGVTIREDPNLGVLVVGVKEVPVQTPEELLRCLEKGSMLRTTASTMMNEQSSRSHAIFTVSIEQTSHAKGETLSAKVRFADLAGSERAKKSGTVGERFREGVSINQGLLALGNVISALGDPKLNRSHVPYRDSKLTRLLQDSLGGNSRTLMIACVSPAELHFAETLNTLKYANRAKNIKNKVAANISVRDVEVARLRAQIQELQAELSTVASRVALCPVSPSCASSDGVDDSRVCELECENKRLVAELAAAEVALQRASEEALKYRMRWEQHSLLLAGEEPTPSEEGARTADSGSTADIGAPDVVQSTLERYVHTIQELQHYTRKLERRLMDREGVHEAELPSSSSADGVADASIDRSLVQEQKCQDEADEGDGVDEGEEKRHLFSQRELCTEVLELDALIREKEALAEELTTQSRVFSSMRETYELRVQQLQEAVEHATEEKERTFREIELETGGGKRKAQLEGRLRELTRQLVELRRRQAEAQRLVRVKEQQETRISRMQTEISRLRGQKEVVQSRMKFEEQQYRLWKKRWMERVRQATRESAQLQRQTNQQDIKLQRLSREADHSARKIEELRSEQKQYLEAARMRVRVEREAARAAKVREANERLQRELADRQRKVEQMEAMIAERIRLQGLGYVRPEELEEVEEQIESLDAQLVFDGECIVRSETQLLQLTSESETHSATARREAAAAANESFTTDGESAIGGLPATCAKSLVERWQSLDEARATCLECFRSIDDLRAERSTLQARIAELEADAAARDAQMEEFQARARLQETQWAEQANALQRLHLDKEAYLLQRVDRGLVEKHQLAEAGAVHADGAARASMAIDVGGREDVAHVSDRAYADPSGGDDVGDAANEDDEATGKDSPPAARTQPSSQFEPTPGLGDDRVALMELLECRQEQIEVLWLESEELRRQLEFAAGEVNAAEEAKSKAMRRLEEAGLQAKQAEDQSKEVEERLQAREEEALRRARAAEDRAGLAEQRLVAVSAEARAAEARAAAAATAAADASIVLAGPVAKTEAGVPDGYTINIYSPATLRRADGERSSALSPPECVETDEDLRERLLQLVGRSGVSGGVGSAAGCSAGCGAAVAEPDEVARRAAADLRGFWSDLGLSAESQESRMRSISEAVAGVCIGELRAQGDLRWQLQRDHDLIVAMLANRGTLSPGEIASEAASPTFGVKPLHSRIAELRGIAKRKLDDRIEQLRVDLKDLFGLPQLLDDPEAYTSHLRVLTTSALGLLPGRPADAAVPAAMDFELLGIARGGAPDGARFAPGVGGCAAAWLLEPTEEAFRAVEERQRQVTMLLNATSSELRRADAELGRHLDALGDTAGERRSSFLASRGFGIPALVATLRELQQLQHAVRLRIADAQLRMTEQWMELGVSMADQELVLQGLRAIQRQGALEELQALIAETSRLEGKMRSRQEILRRVSACTELEAEIQGFERGASSSERLRGSSTKLLQEEQQRLRFRRRKARLMEDILARISEWEGDHGERFVHRGVVMREALQQDLDDTLELGSLTLAQSAATAQQTEDLGVQSPTPASSTAAVPSAQAPPSARALAPAVGSAAGIAALCVARSLQGARLEAASARAAAAAVGEVPRTPPTASMPPQHMQRRAVAPAGCVTPARLNGTAPSPRLRGGAATLGTIAKSPDTRTAQRSPERTSFSL